MSSRFKSNPLATGTKPNKSVSTPQSSSTKSRKSTGKRKHSTYEHNVKRRKRPCDVPPQPKREVRSEVQVAFQLFNVNPAEEYEVLDLDVSKENFLRWFSQENMGDARMTEINNKIAEWFRNVFMKDR
eukprot:UN21333